MSRASTQTAQADYNHLHDKPAQLAQKMVEHRSEPFYLSEIVALAGGRVDAMQQAAGGHADVFKDAQKAHDDITKGRQAASETNTHMLIEHMQEFRWGTGAEAMVMELENHGRLEKFGNDVHRIEPEWTSQVGRMVGKAVADGLVPASAVVAFNGQGWDAHVISDREKQASLGSVYRTPAATDAAEHESANDLTLKRKELETAEKGLRELDNELSKELAGDHIGATLTDDKKVAYIRAFQNKDEYKKAVARVNAASQALGLTLKRDGADLAAFGADDKDPVQAGQAGGDLMATYRALAVAPHNSPLIAAVADHPPAALAGNKKELEALAERSLEIDQPLEFAHLREIFEAAEAKEKGTGIIAVLGEAKKRLCEPYEAFNQFRGLAKVSRQIDRALPAYQSYLKIRDTLKPVEKQKKLAEVIELFAGEEDRAAVRVGKGLAALVGGAAEAGEFAKTGQLQSLANAILGQGREFLAAANAGKEGAELTTAAKGVGLAGAELKLLPLMAIALGGVQLFEDGAAFAKSKNPADLVAGVGDALSIVGGAVMCVPGLQPIGEAINVVGSAITYIAHLFRGDPEGDKRRKDEKGTLVETHAYGNVTGELAQTLTNPAAKGALDRVGKDAVKWSPEQIQEVARLHPFLFTESHLMDTADNVRKFYMQDKNGGLSTSHTSSLHQFVTTFPGDKMKQVLEIASRSTFAFVANADLDMTNAIYSWLQQCFDKSQWKNNDPYFRHMGGL
jgi:hypothetical protein